MSIEPGRQWNEFNPSDHDISEREQNLMVQRATEAANKSRLLGAISPDMIVNERPHGLHAKFESHGHTTRWDGGPEVTTTHDPSGDYSYSSSHGITTNSDLTDLHFEHVSEMENTNQNNELEDEHKDD